MMLIVAQGRAREETQPTVFATKNAAFAQIVLSRMHARLLGAAGVVILRNAPKKCSGNAGRL